MDTQAAMTALVPKKSRNSSTGGPLDLRDTDISDDIECRSLFPTSYGTSTLGRRSTRLSKVAQVANENHRSLRAWRKKTFSRGRLPNFENSDSDHSEVLPPQMTDSAPKNKNRPKMSRRKSLSGLVQAMAIRMVKDTPCHDVENKKYHTSSDETRVGSPDSEESVAFEKLQVPLSCTPISYLLKPRERSECSSTFRHGIDDAVKLITGEGLSIVRGSGDQDVGATRVFKTPLNTPAPSIADAPARSGVANQASEYANWSGQLVTLVLPTQEDSPQCDAYHLYFHELFAFLGACPPSFSVLGIYDASRRVYYLQPPTSFDESLPGHSLGTEGETMTLQSLPAGLRRFLAERSSQRDSDREPTSRERASTNTSYASASSLGVETEPATKKKLRSDITEILRLLTAHQEEKARERNKVPEGPTEAEVLRDNVVSKLSTAFDTISSLIRELKSESLVEQDFSGKASGALAAATPPKSEVDLCKSDVMESCSASSSASSTEPFPRLSDGEFTSDVERQARMLAEAPPCKVQMAKFDKCGDSVFVVNAESLENRTRIPQSGSEDGDMEDGAVGKRGRSISSTGPFFTGSWRHEARTDFVSPFRAARFGQRRNTGSEVSDSNTEVSEGSTDMMVEAILVANGTLEVD